MKIESYSQEITPELFALLLMADPDHAAVGSYISCAEILVAREGNLLIGVGVLVKEDSIFELKNLAVLEKYQGRGIAKALISEIKRLAKTLGASMLEVGTGNSSLSQLALYQKSGFRMYRIEQDYFKDYPEPIFENGIRCLDMVRLRVTL